MNSHTGQANSQGRATFIAGAFVGFLFGVILGLSSCQSAGCTGSPMSQSHSAVVAGPSSRT